MFLRLYKVDLKNKNLDLEHFITSHRYTFIRIEYSGIYSSYIRISHRHIKCYI